MKRYFFLLSIVVAGFASICCVEDSGAEETAPPEKAWKPSVPDLNKYFAAHGLVRENRKHFKSLLPADKDYLLILLSSEFRVSWVIWAWRIDDEILIGGFFPHAEPSEQWLGDSRPDAGHPIMKNISVFDEARKIYNDLREKKPGARSGSWTMHLYVQVAGEIKQMETQFESSKAKGSALWNTAKRIIDYALAPSNSGTSQK